MKRTIHLLKKLKALNVAEKPSVAKNVAGILSNNSFSAIDSKSKYNPVYEFDLKIKEKEYSMHFTSVRGHLMTWEFPPENKKWELDKIEDLYSVNINRNVEKTNDDIYSNLKFHSKNTDLLIIWTDCDREGESIGFEVIEVVKGVSKNVKVLRAKFSSLTFKDITKAIDNLVEPDQNLSNAVEIRQLIDLIIGASFTRLQTLLLKPLFYPNLEYNSSSSIISYGPCQFPTLNFIVERAEKITNFESQEFHYVEMKIVKNGIECILNWKRGRLFDSCFTRTIHEKIIENSVGKVNNYLTKPTFKLRPLPLNTIELQKILSRKLKIPSHKTMEAAEKLYNKGLISYPRTETQKYSNSENLRKKVDEIKKLPIFSRYANELLKGKFQSPRDGKLDDKAHPPIHPVKAADYESLLGYEKLVYEFIVKHFLASVSPDATAMETQVEIEISEEIFTSKGIAIENKGYLEIYEHENWNDNLLPKFKIGEEVKPQILLKNGFTTAPNFLTESELISLMDKFGIGTDATIHEHIKHVQERGYALNNSGSFRPTLFGNCLINCYRSIGVEIYKPFLRAAMEKEMTEVGKGLKDKEIVLHDMKENMLKIYKKVFQSSSQIKNFARIFLSKNVDFKENIEKENKGEPNKSNENFIIGNCPSCKVGQIRVIFAKTQKYFIGCSKYPKCNFVKNFPSPPKNIQKKELCGVCKKNKKSNFKFEIEYENLSEKATLCLGDCFSIEKSKSSQTKRPFERTYSKKKVEVVTEVKSEIVYENESNVKEGKICKLCGTIGRHSKDSDCSSIKRKKDTDKVNESKKGKQSASPDSNLAKNKKQNIASAKKKQGEDFIV